MTILAYKDGVLAADQAVSWNGIIIGYRYKLHIWPDRIAGFCGNAGNQQEMFEWLNSPNNSPPEFGDDESDDSALVITTWRQIFCYGPKGIGKKDWSFLYGQFVAVGSAAELAIGAMAAGASATEAVEICIERADGCGGAVDSLSVPK